jgi:hypothetical protein
MVASHAARMLVLLAARQARPRRPSCLVSSGQLWRALIILLSFNDNGCLNVIPFLILFTACSGKRKVVERKVVRCRTAGGSAST